MKKLKSILAVGALLVCQVMSMNAQQTIFSENFESGTSNWTLHNGGINKWYCGPATYAGASGKSMYISDMANYRAVASAAVEAVFFSRDVAFPTGNMAGYHLSFNWKGSGNITLRVYVQETSYTPTVGQSTHGLDSAVIHLHSASGWTQANIVLPASYAGSTKRLIFEWVRPMSIGQTNSDPGAVDDIVLKTVNAASKTMTATAGVLQNSLSSQEANTTTHLTLTGTIDARDFKFMRDNMPVLLNLDLSGATINQYVGTAGTVSASTTYPANTVPQCAFGSETVGISKDASLHSIILPNGITSIGQSAFAYCCNLSEVSFPNGLLTISPSAFRYCRSLRSIDLPNALTTVGDYAFIANRSLTSLVIPNNVDTLGERAFCQCNLTSATLGKTLKHFKLEALAENYAMSNITFKGSTPPTAQTSAFAGITKTIPVHIPCATLAAYQGRPNINAFTNMTESVAPELIVLSADTAKGTVAITTSNTCASQQATIAATPKAGHRFVQWNDGNTTATRNVTVTADVTYTATFIATYQITVAANNAAWGSVTGGGTFDDGASAAISATPNATYQFVQWSDGNAQASRTVTVTATATYTAEFASVAVPTHTITVLSGNPALGTVTGGGSFPENSNITIIATPTAGNRFVQWTDGDSNSARTVTVTAAATYVASFEAIPSHLITVVPNNVVWGTVTGGGMFVENSTITISATPNSGYRFVKWDDGNAITPRTVTVTGNATYTAEFASTSANTFSVTVLSDDPTMGTVAGGGSFTENTVTLIVATPNANHRFVQWNDGNNQNPRSITVTADAIYTASFAPITHTITTTVNDATMGTVTGGGMHLVNSTVVLTATPNTGFRFVQWQDGSTVNPRTITVTGDATYTATFEKVTYKVTVLSNNPTWGTVTGDSTYDHNAIATITATPNTGYKFVKWQEDNSTIAVLQIVVTAAATYTAEFEPENSIYDAQASAVSIYPNPAVESITISLPDHATSATFVIYDLQGRVLLQQTLNSDKETVSVIGLSSGIYTYSVSTEAQRYNGRLNIVK